MTLQTMGLPRAAPYTDSVEQLGSRVDSIFDELTRELRDVNFSDLNGQVSDSQVPESAVTQHQGAIDHGSIAGLGDDDHPQYGALAQDETVSGAWTFSGTPVIIGSDPGGSDLLRVGGAARIDTVRLHTTATDNATVSLALQDGTIASTRALLRGSSENIFIGDVDNNGGELHFRSAGADRMVLETNGSLVIGSDPGGSELLRVGGEVRFDSGGADGDEGVFVFTGQNGSARLDIVADENNSGETNLPTLRLDQDGSAVAWELSGQSDNAVRLASQDSPSTSDALEIARGGRMVRLDGGSGPSSGGLENIVHHGSGSPSAVGVDGTIHTQDA